jgi:hypothetical protein
VPATRRQFPNNGGCRAGGLDADAANEAIFAFSLPHCSFIHVCNDLAFT